MRKKRIDDETILAGLLTHGSIRATASALDISERVIYQRLHDGDFTEKYENAKAEILKDTVTHITSKMSDAVDVISDIMVDDFSANSTRLAAAKAMLEYGIKVQACARDIVPAEKRSDIADGSPMYDALTAALRAEAARCLEEQQGAQ